MKKKIFYLAIILSIIWLLFGDISKIREYDGFIYWGYTGIGNFLLGKSDKVFYMNEYTKYDLNGADGPYIFYGKDNTYEIITVNKNSVLNKTSVKQIDSVEVITSSEKYFKFEFEDNYKIPSDNYKIDGKIFVVSDIEGNFDFFLKLLTSNNIVDSDYKWNFGNGHLVLLGDILDRGQDVTQTLWLCYKLDIEARKFGGKVHLLLGNHEQLNLIGSSKYASYKYIALCQKLDIPYKKLYNETILGKWLQSKNSIEIINNILFCHGGISSSYLNDDISLINQKIRFEITSTKVEDNNYFKNRYTGINGPLWYRGYFYKTRFYDKITQGEVDAICERYKVKTMYYTEIG